MQRVKASYTASRWATVKTLAYRNSMRQMWLMPLRLIVAAFMRRNGGHARLVGCTDHHLLHYLVTAACCLHVPYLLKAMQKSAAHVD